jgi:hypothetical protein
MRAPCERGANIRKTRERPRVTSVCVAAWSSVGTSDCRRAPSRIRRCSMVVIRLFKPRRCSGSNVGNRSWGQAAGRSGAGRIARWQQKGPFAGLFRSPLTDSNRRPPPYHGGCAPLLCAAGRLLRRGLSLQRGVFRCLLDTILEGPRAAPEGPEPVPKPGPKRAVIGALDGDWQPVCGGHGWRFVVLLWRTTRT